MPTDAKRRPMIATILLLLLCVLPGTSHILLGKTRQGAIMLAIGLFALNGMFVLGPNLEPREQGSLLYTVSMIVLVALWGLSVASLIGLSFRAVNPELERQSRANFKNGMVDYMKNDLDQARLRLEEAASVDADDPDTQFHLAMIYKQKGMAKEAKKAFKRSLALDAQKWSWEIHQELKDL